MKLVQNYMIHLRWLSPWLSPIDERQWKTFNLLGTDSNYRNVRTCEPWKIYKKWKNRGNVVKNVETLDKIGKPGNFEEVHFFPVSAPVDYEWRYIVVLKLVKCGSTFKALHTVWWLEHLEKRISMFMVKMLRGLRKESLIKFLIPSFKHYSRILKFWNWWENTQQRNVIIRKRPFLH